MAILAGSTATLLCYPLDVIRTRMLSNSGDLYLTARGTVKAILRDETIASFYVGCAPAVVSTAASGAIFYGVYDILKSRHSALLGRQGAKEGAAMSAARTMLYGALAGAAAESILYPLEVLRRRWVTRLQFQWARGGVGSNLYPLKVLLRRKRTLPLP